MLASEATSNRDRNAATKEKEKNAQALTELADWERDVIYPPRHPTPRDRSGRRRKTKLPEIWQSPRQSPRPKLKIIFI